METNFLCPHCKSVLNIDGKIILTAEKQNNDKGLILLHQEIGNYSIFHDKSFNLEKNETVEFFCPVCHNSLQHQKNKNLVRIIMEKDDKKLIMLFSNIYGEECTYIVQDSDVKSYGECAKKYTNPDWFMEE